MPRPLRRYRPDAAACEPVNVTGGPAALQLQQDRPCRPSANP